MFSVLGYVRFTLYRIELLFKHKNGDFGAISTTKPSCAAPRRSLNRGVTQLMGVYVKPDTETPSLGQFYLDFSVFYWIVEPLTIQN